MMGDWKIEPFYKHVERGVFSCGEPALDAYLATYAGQHEQAGIARTFLAINKKNEGLVGYYSLSMSSIPRDYLPETLQRRFPAFPIPVARLVRLAVDQKLQGQGVGEFLFISALQQCYKLSKEIGMVAVVVDAKHERAAQFYQRYGFDSLPNQPLLLWLNAKKLGKLFE
ncbi:GNAT family N-acetyltransferase [Candidatus Thiothrix anitrata]|uniref:GNAT family N-acetyltransferase n=1 Tax=Candidatus Thiothrix anitrata TaxID=2823902 RepID=A0ABX7X8Q9_9GAMM|nr:GNAT family N-acetyltransferase [Candidatus Thiothrix anitrata]QTR51612.1 GNAT family N-acetyltransferase [Candidatus Thiothrix anitrata]